MLLIRKKEIILIVLNVLLLIAFFACLLLSGSVRGTLRSQQAAKAWAGQSGERFAQLSVFISDRFTFNDEALFNHRATIDRELVSASLEASGDRVLYTDAWSAEGDVVVTGERGSASVKAFGVGGDFFLFHPLYLRDGSYLSPGDVMKDRVVLDEELAWRLFGSVKVAGLEISIKEKPYLIAGVVSREKDFASSKAYTYGAGMFMSIEALRELSEGTHIKCYEIVMPDPITGFAMGVMTGSFPDRDVQIVENSARYTLSVTFDNISSFAERSMRVDGIIYPYWENAARYTEDLLALLLVLMLMLIICPVVYSVIYGTKAIRLFYNKGRGRVSKALEQHDERRAEKYLQDNAEEFVSYSVDDIIREVQEEEEQDKNGSVR